jgi:hypothetical protein
MAEWVTLSVKPFRPCQQPPLEGEAADEVVGPVKRGGEG